MKIQKQPANKKEKIYGIESNKSPIKETLETSVKFSFKYLEFTDKFNIPNDDKSNYMFKVIERIQAINQYSVANFKDEIFKPKTKNTFRAHRIDWQDVTESSFGLLNEDQIVSDPVQFAISSNAHGRIHGFFIDDTFYVRWLDPYHNLYSKSKPRISTFAPRENGLYDLCNKISECDIDLNKCNFERGEKCLLIEENRN